MDKKLKIGIGLVVVVVVGGAVGVSVIKKGEMVNPLSPTSSKQTTKNPEVSESMTTYKDANVGFTFDYPKSLSVNTHPEDQDNYAHVELSSSPSASSGQGPSGNIVVWAKDTTYKDLSDWVKSDKTVSGGSVIDTSWGGQSARKVIVRGTTSKIVTGVLYDNLLFLLEVNPDKEGKLDKTYNAILNNFTFEKIGSTSTSDSSGGTDNTADISGGDDGGDEEVVQ